MADRDDRTPIEPALTRQEWADLSTDTAWIDSNGFPRLDIAPGGLIVCSDSGRASRYGDRHALAALALHGQPFGFTHDHVAALRFVVDLAEGYDDYRLPLDFDKKRGPRIELARQTIDRIEALLPPNTEGD